MDDFCKKCRAPVEREGWECCSCAEPDVAPEVLRSIAKSLRERAEQWDAIAAKKEASHG